MQHNSTQHKRIECLGVWLSVFDIVMFGCLYFIECGHLSRSQRYVGENFFVPIRLCKSTLFSTTKYGILANAILAILSVLCEPVYMGISNL